MTMTNDVQLWDRLRGGDRVALQTIYLSEVQYLFNYGRKVFQDDIRTEDSIHDLFVELWEKRERLGTTDNIRKYLTVSMRRKIVANLKKEKRTSADMELENLPFESELSIEQLIINKELSEEQSGKLEAAYNQLSKRQKEILHMRYYQDIPYDQIAEIIGIKYQSLRNVVSTAIKGLRVALACGLIFLMVVSCSEDTESFLGIDAEVQPYIERFEAEAAYRNLTVDIESSGIGAVIERISGEAIGQCISSTTNGEFLRLDANYWNRASDMQREFLIFHELGHCYLGRDHDDRRAQGGVCISMMMSGTGSCRSNYNAATRHAYIDELFSN